MEKKTTMVLAVVVVLVVAAVGGYFLLAGDDDGYRSANTDCRLQILGNADEDDYLDSRDVSKIKEMIENNKYSLMADADNNGKVDQADVNKVQSIIDARENNKGKAFADKTKVTVNYISVDKDVLSATYPVGNIIIANSQRALELAIALGVDDRVKAMTLSDLKSYWDDKEYAGCETIPDVGLRKEPNLEEIAKIDADTIYTGQKSKCVINVDGNKAGNKQILRLATWENGGLENGALMLGFFMEAEKEAEEYVKWMDDINKEIQDKLSKVADKDKIKFLVHSSPTALAVQQDGVSTALDKVGATNIGNQIITDPSKSYGKTSDYKEAILEKQPEYIFFAFYIMTQMTDDDIQAKYDAKADSWNELVGMTNAYKNDKIVMIDYGNPFCLITLVGAHVLFEDTFSKEYVLDKVQEYTDRFTNAPDGFKVEYSHCVAYP